jgi:hypothetical protein
MSQHCCYLLHTHIWGLFLPYKLAVKQILWHDLPDWVSIPQANKFIQKHRHSQLITDLGVSHFLKMFCHQWEAFSQHSSTQDCSPNLAFCSSLISGCVQHRTFIHPSHYLWPLPQILGYDKQVNQNLMQVLLIIYKPEKVCVLHPGFP